MTQYKIEVFYDSARIDFSAAYDLVHFVAQLRDVEGVATARHDDRYSISLSFGKLFKVKNIIKAIKAKLDECIEVSELSPKELN